MKTASKAIAEAVRQSIRQMESAKKTKPPLPPKYSRRATSDLRKDVVDGDNVINIELTN